MLDLRVKLPPQEAARLIDTQFTAHAISALRIDSQLRAKDGKEAILLVYEKYFMRNSSRATLTVMLDNLDGVTTVHAVGSGGGQNALLGFDWGAKDDLIYQVEKALREYIITKQGGTQTC